MMKLIGYEKFWLGLKPHDLPIYVPDCSFCRKSEIQKYQIKKK